MNKLNRLKEVIKFYLYRSINFFIHPNGKILPKTILFIRLDAIGDYILFRNFIQILKTKSKYKNYKIILIGNIVWKEIAEKLDNFVVDKFIWINKRQFKRNLFYRYKKLKEISRTGYEIVIHPTYEIDFSADFIVPILNAKYKIRNKGKEDNIFFYQRRFINKCYNELVHTDKNVVFEFDRNKNFFENLLDISISLKRPYITLLDNNLSLGYKKFVLFCIGAGEKFRKWSIKNYAEIANYIYKKFHFPIILCGTHADDYDAIRFSYFYNYEGYNLVGRTNLFDLLKIINKASLVISNETSVPHMAVALNKPVIVISNGNHFGRFTPYPYNITDKYFAIYPPEIQENIYNSKELIVKYGQTSRLDINKITPDKVKELIDIVMNNYNIFP